MLILIRFPDQTTEKKALEFYNPPVSGKNWNSREAAVPPAVLPILAEQGLHFSVLGPAPIDATLPMPGPLAVAGDTEPYAYVKNGILVHHAGHRITSGDVARALADE